jgi:hypothetical protein
VGLKELGGENKEGVEMSGIIKEGVWEDSIVIGRWYDHTVMVVEIKLFEIKIRSQYLLNNSVLMSDYL